MLDIDAGTVRELIDALEEQFPALRDAGLSGMSVAIDGEVMPNADFELIGPESEIHFLSAISGGRGDAPTILGR
jgi:hypothetical protein